jgi:uncharacterized protein
MAAVLSLGLAPPLDAAPFDEGTAAYGRGDYTTAMQLLRPLADQGNADAQIYLGFMYLNGRGVPQDDAAAATWYRRAAEQGHPLAQSNLGLSCEYGRGVPRDDAVALSWYRKAADQGYAPSQVNLGLVPKWPRGSAG